MRWLVVTVVFLLVALALNLGLLAYAMYAMLGIIVLSRTLADRWSAHLTATRATNRDHVKIGDSVAVVTVIENGTWLPIPWLLLEDLLPRRALVHNPPNLQITGRRLQLVSFRGRGRKTISYQLKCNCRGYYQLGPLVAETGDVFGLYRRYRILSEPSFVLVYPEVIPLAGFDIASRRPIGEVRMSHRLFEDPTRIAGVRGYQSGDPLNRIHWRATARTGVLHSKIYEPSTVAGATILLDFHQDSFAAADEPVRSELAVTAAASLAGALPDGATSGADHQRPGRCRANSPRRLESRTSSHTPRSPGGGRRTSESSPASGDRADAAVEHPAGANPRNPGPRREVERLALCRNGTGNHQPHAAKRDGDRALDERHNRGGPGPGQPATARDGGYGDCERIR